MHACMHACIHTYMHPCMQRRTIYPELPLVSYRRDRNLRDYLVHSAERTDSDAGTFACRLPRCLTCRHTTSRSQTILQRVSGQFAPRTIRPGQFPPNIWTIPPQFQDNSPPISGQFAPEEENDKTTAYKIVFCQFDRNHAFSKMQFIDRSSIA